MGEEKKLMSKIIKPLARGQITIPVEFRQKLGIDETTLLNLTLKGKRLELTPVVIREREEEELRDYSEEEIAEFLREDKIDQETAKAVKRLLAEGKL
ncbi:MAG: hypothetical protein DDT19_03002 [Syntrophomonadaceae bacterium]|nr:hypothetical protein [Bacillota bacterium]